MNHPQDATGRSIVRNTARMTHPAIKPTPRRTPRATATCRRRRGAATVELAVVAPLIFLLIFAAVEFGRLLMATHGLEEAAREGCRKAILANATATDVQNTVAARLATFGISGYTLTTNPSSPSSACQFEPITVRIVVPYSNVSWLPTPRFLNTIQLNASCTLSQESDPCGS